MTKYIILLFSSFLFAQTTVSVVPVNSYINTAGTVSVQIWVNNVTNLHSTSITIDFNNSVLAYTNVVNGTFLQTNPNGYSVFLGKTLYPNSTNPNRIVVDQAILGNSGASGSGLLFTVTYTASHSGTSPISLPQVTLMDVNSNTISQTKIPGNVYVAMTISPKVYLQGPFNGTNLNTNLNSGFLPLTQPYSSSPWNYSGTESVASGFYTTHTNIVDWVLVELRSGTQASTTVAQKAAFLLNNGNLVDLDGSSPLRFYGPLYGNYYVVIKHRNHLSIMSASTQLCDISNLTYDFTTSQNQAYNSSYLPMKELSNGSYGMYSGDANADGSVDAIDINLYWRPNNGQPYNYSKGADFNLDASIDALDLNSGWRPNNGKGTQVPF